MDKKRIRVYCCEDSLEGILSAVHEAYYSRYGHKFIRISEDDNMNLDLFCDYVDVATDYEKAESVATSIRKKISYQSWEVVMYSSLCRRQGKGQDIYRFLNYGFEIGGRVVDCLGEEHVRRVMYDRKTVSRELDRMMGFTRFMELKDGSLLAKIGPKNNLVPLLAPHFADRFPEEKWAIVDVNRGMIAVHYPNLGWNLMKGEWNDSFLADMLSGEEKRMRQCWQTFHDTIAIESRTNLKLQQQMMPKYYRTYMTETFDNSSGYFTK